MKSNIIKLLSSKFTYNTQLIIILLGLLLLHSEAAFSDASESLGSKVKHVLLHKDQAEFSEVRVIEFKGRVLLIGNVANENASMKASRLAENVEGVKEVINYLSHFVKPILNMVNYSQFEKDIEQELANISGIEPSDFAYGVNAQGIFIIGQADSQKKIDEVLHAIADLKWAKRIYSFILLQDEIRSNTNWLNKTLDLTAIDNAIYDRIKFTSTNELKKYLEPINVKKGQMILIDKAEAEKLSKEIVANKEFAGGSSANSVANIQFLGGETAFLGITDQDKAGYKFNQSLEQLGVKVLNQPKKLSGSSGQCFILVTPDGERTMLTHLGVSNDFTESDINYSVIKDSKIVLLQAYLLDSGQTTNLVEKVVDFARANNTLTALALSSVFKVNKQKNEIFKLLPKIDILIGNEKEFEALFDENNTIHIINKLKNMHLTSLFTMSGKGAFVVNKKNVIYVPAPLVDNMVDQTGAGDAFAGGFLYGFTHGYSLQDAAKIGSGAAKSILGKVGGRPSEDIKNLRFMY